MTSNQSVWEQINSTHSAPGETLTIEGTVKLETEDGGMSVAGDIMVDNDPDPDNGAFVTIHSWSETAPHSPFVLGLNGRRVRVTVEVLDD